ncbi:MAG: NAD(P)/FAD-dependent oxidoreductase [Sulfurimonas sp.]|nr:NAD(P)/FAD-dependent oxidoreductase [Sulfurimonas sp.]
MSHFKMPKKVAIIGGGASGLLSALFCAKAGAHVDVFEQNARCGKKILVSGNGRCNISNKNLSVADFFGENPSFVAFGLQEFGFDTFERFANSIGLLLETKEDGRAYPLSNEAKSVVKIFESYAKTLGVHFHTDTKITDIKELACKYDATIIATGSEAASHLGGCADGYAFAQAFGHTIIPTYPSLVQLQLNSSLPNKMSGAKLNAEVTLLCNNKKESLSNGDLLFTNYGVSGFAILDISQRASVALLNYEAVDITLNLLPSWNAQKLASHIQKMGETMPELTILDILAGLIPLKIAQILLENLQIAHETKTQDIHTKLAKKIANALLNWRFEVSETHGFRHAEVSGGGVNTLEVNPKTMESLLHKNIYFCGEVLDVLGRRGGYNFAWAWASAYLAAREITKD